MRTRAAVLTAPLPLLSALAAVIVAVIAQTHVAITALWVLAAALLVVTLFVWRHQYLAKRNELAADLHPRLIMVMPFRQHEAYLEILAHISVDNRGAFTETRDWQMSAKVNGEVTLGTYSGSVAWDDHVENKAARINFGEIRSGLFSSTFYGATLETLSLDSVVMRCWDAFGKQYTAGPAKSEDVIRHFPRPPSEDA